MRRLALLVCLLFAANARGADTVHWWNRDYPYRKHVVLSRTQTWPDADSAHVRLSTGGRALPTGADIRVVNREGREVPRAVVARGPGDLYEVAFPVAGEREWYVYYGNPAAKPPREEWEPTRGLVLETRERGAGEPNDWAGMQGILSRSGKVFGGSYWPRVFDAENPFGPSDNFVSDYHGFLLAPTKGRYTFYTASDEASFLFVDSTLVAQWPGWHRANQGAWAKYKGAIDLAAGFHRFRYVHVERVGPQVMAAYWLVPGAKKAAVIPATAFPGLLDAEIAGHETLGKPLGADFTDDVAEKWGRDDRVYSAVTLKAQLGGPDTRYRWDFGDGLSGEGPIVTHVYLRGGEYDVKLAVTEAGESDEVTRRIRVPDEWTRYDRNREETLARLARLAGSYPGRRLSAEEVENLAYLLTEAGLRERALAVERDAVDGSTLLDPAARYALAMKLGDAYRDDLEDLAGATWAYSRAASAAGRGGKEVAARVALAGANLLLGGDPGVAQKLLTTAVEELGNRGGEVATLAWLRLGDARMLAGDTDGAKDAYGRAEEIAGGAENATRILRKAAAARAAITFIETKDLERATEELRTWEMDAPTDRFSGLHRLARARAFRLAKRPDLAERELAGLLSGNPESEYAPQALADLADLAKAAGDEAKAAAFLARLKKDYPWSPLAK